MLINTLKSECIHFGRRNQNLQYSFSNGIIPTVHLIRDLGLIVDDNLNFKDHVAICVANVFA